jgi:hypothetical protein
MQAPEPSGPAIQQAPGEMPKPAAAPIIPPLAAPAVPSWKQEQPGNTADTMAKTSVSGSEADKDLSKE